MCIYIIYIERERDVYMYLDIRTRIKSPKNPAEIVVRSPEFLNPKTFALPNY